MTSSNPNYPLETSSPNTITLGLGVQYMNLGRTQIFSPQQPVIQMAQTKHLFFHSLLPSFLQYFQWSTC